MLLMFLSFEVSLGQGSQWLCSLGCVHNIGMGLEILAVQRSTNSKSQGTKSFVLVTHDGFLLKLSKVLFGQL